VNLNETSQSGRVRLGQVLLTFAALALMLVAMTQFRAPENAVEVERPDTEVARVIVSEVGMQPFELSVRAVGRVSPWQEVSLAAEVVGRIEAVHVDIGDRVAAGATLVSIETGDYETSVREAEAGLLRAEARLEESQAALARMASLRERGAVSDREYEAAVATQRAAEADLRTAEAVLDRARDNLQDTSLTAPFAGTIVERHVDPGALVGGDRALVVLADLDTIAVETGLTEGEIFLARQAGAATVASTTRPGLVAEGVIDGIGERADPSTGTYMVRVKVDNRDSPRFLGGMVVDVEIPYDRLEAVATVPAAAVIAPDRDPHVFVLRDGRATRVDVTVMAREQDRLGVVAREAEEGSNGALAAALPLQLGDLVVVVGQTQLTDGTTVEVAAQR
jgi:RND family efflux transporter MFP subunit